MEDFEAPSFSLGFEEEIHREKPTPECPSFHEGQTPATANRECFIVVSGDDDESEFQSPWPNRTHTVLKRLRRKSSPSFSFSQSKANVEGKSSEKELNQRKKGICESKGSAQGRNGSSERNGSSQRKNGVSEYPSSSKRTSGIKGNTLESLWKNLNGKVSGFSDGSTVKPVCEHDDASLDQNASDRHESRRIQIAAMDGYTGTFCKEFTDNHVTDFDERTFDPPRFSLTDEDPSCKILFVKANISQQDGIPSNLNRSEKQITEESSFDPPKFSLTDEDTDLVNPSCKILLGKTDILQQDEIHGKSNNDNPIPSSCKDIETASSSFTRNELEEKKSDRCFMGDKTPGTENVSVNGANPLQSFWKSLGSMKPSQRESNVDVEYEDIEDCSTEDDFDMEARSTPQIGPRSAKKPLLCRNVSAQTTPTSVHHCYVSGQNNSPIFHHNNVSGQNNFTFTSAPSSNPPRESFINTDMGRQNPVLFKENFPSQKRIWRSMNSSNTSSSSPNIPRNMSSDFDTVGAASSNLDSRDVNNHTNVGRNSHTGDKQMHNDDDLDLFFPEGNNGSFAYVSNCDTEGSFKGSTRIWGSLITQDPRIRDLLQQRFPHFTPVSALRQRIGFGPEQVYIDYESQFAEVKNTSAPDSTNFVQPKTRRFAGRSAKRLSKARTTPKMQKIAVADNDGWINTGNRNQNSLQRRGQGKQSGEGYGIADEESGAVDTGHWVTERTGKRIYITKDGKKLSGTSAYKQHMKDSGKRLKKTKRRRPQGRKKRS